jgi:hypothetical protein
VRARQVAPAVSAVEVDLAVSAPPGPPPPRDWVGTVKQPGTTSFRTRPQAGSTGGPRALPVVRLGVAEDPALVARVDRALRVEPTGLAVPAESPLRVASAALAAEVDLAVPAPLGPPPPRDWVGKVEQPGTTNSRTHPQAGDASAGLTAVWVPGIARIVGSWSR